MAQFNPANLDCRVVLGESRVVVWILLPEHWLDTITAGGHVPGLSWRCTN
jgi:hypothetical protein